MTGSKRMTTKECTTGPYFMVAHTVHLFFVFRGALSIPSLGASRVFLILCPREAMDCRPEAQTWRMCFVRSVTVNYYGRSMHADSGEDVGGQVGNYFLCLPNVACIAYICGADSLSFLEDADEQPLNSTLRMFRLLPVLTVIFFLMACGGQQDPLIRAAKDGRMEEVKRMLANGHDVNTRGKTGDTALMWAAFYGRKELLQLLIKKGADVDAKDEKGWTSVIVASEQGYPEIIKILGDKGADVNAKDSKGRSALSIAKLMGRDNVQQVLEDHGATDHP